MRYRRTVAAVAIGLTGLVAAACGSGSTSSPKSSAPAGSVTPATSPSATTSGSPINIGNIGSYSGTQASSEGGAEQVIKAWAQSVNDAGGIDGHPLNLIVKDLGSNPAGGLDAAKELVTQDHVVAIVGEQDNADTTWASYIASTGVPVIGGLPINVPFVTNPDFFASGTDVFADVYGIMALAKKAGSSFAYLYCAESPQCASAVPLYSGYGQLQGVSTKISAKVSGTAPDYTAVCQRIKSSGVSSYSVGDASAVVVRVTQACKALGVKAVPLANDGSASASWESISALDGVILSEVDVPFTDTSTVGGRAYQALLAKYLPKLGAENGPNSEYAFVAGRLFQAAAAGAGATITSTSLKQALWAMKGETLDGLAPPLTFTQGQPAQVNCYFTMELTGGAFTEPDGATPTCAPDAVIAGTLKQLAAAAG